MGQTLRGDDALGPIVANELKELLTDSGSLLILDAGPAPENFTGKIRRFGPDVVMLVDAAQMDERAGEIRLLDQRACTGLSASTHTLPPSVIADYMSQEMGCEVALLGIQPLQTELGAPLSGPIRAAADRAVTGIVETLRTFGIAATNRDLIRSEAEPNVERWASAGMSARSVEDD
jgi:hydrogenase 3 maturation protease